MRALGMLWMLRLLSAWEVSAAVRELPAELPACGSVDSLSVSDRQSPRGLVLSGTQRARIPSRVTWASGVSAGRRPSIDPVNGTPMARRSCLPVAVDRGCILRASVLMIILSAAAPAARSAD